MNEETKILIADDHYLIAKLIKMMLTTSVYNYKVETVRNSKEISQFIDNFCPHLILLDIDMPDIDGMQILKKLKQTMAYIKIMMISNHLEPWIIKRALNFGANGYISKYADSDEILHAIRAVLNDEIFLCQNSVKALYASQQSKEINDSEKISITKSIGSLSNRELEVLKLVVEEYSTKEISEKLFISTRTVETHRKNILNKMGVKNSISLVKLFIESNMLESVNLEQTI